MSEKLTLLSLEKRVRALEEVAGVGPENTERNTWLDRVLHKYYRSEKPAPVPAPADGIA